MSSTGETAQNKTDLGEMSAAELSALFSARAASPVEATRAALARIERFNPDVNAFAHVVSEMALEAARASEARWLKGCPASPIDGAPTTIKELTPVIGIPWRRGSALSDKTPSKHEVLIVKRLKAAGAVILGTTASPEFGWKGVTHGPAIGNTLNPWRSDRASGGSSGGAAVAAALNMGVLHEGSDGAGSIRIPASFSGVFGVKPTQGWIPADAPSALFELGHRGPLTRSVEDSTLFLGAVTGPSALAQYGVCPAPVPVWRQAIWGSIKGLRIGYSRNLGYADVAPGVAAAVERAAGRMRELGAVVEDVDPGFRSPQEALLTLWYVGMAQRLQSAAPTDEQKKRMDPGLLEIVGKARDISAADYVAARQTVCDLKVTMALFHERFDALMLPSMPVTAIPAGVDKTDPNQRDWSDWSPFTYPFNLTGQPAVSVPCGFDQDGLPVGLQFVGAQYADMTVLKLAATYQRAFPEPFPQAPKSA